MSIFSSYVEDIIRDEANSLIAEYSHLLQKVDNSFSADKWISRSAEVGISHAKDLLAAIESLENGEVFGEQPHPYSLEEMLSGSGWEDQNTSEAVRHWRRNLNSVSYETVPSEDRKEIFDYFFRHDVHGKLDDSNTLRLSRGVNDPEYFLPPAVINVAIEAASKNNWFGYSDSLGHIDTRKSIAELEQTRRTQSNITNKNTAVVQGGTAGLNAVLSMISRSKKNGQCVIAAPNYAPIIDDVEHHFSPRILELDSNYMFDKEQLLRLANESDTAVVLLSIPHNPAGFRDFIDILPELHFACKSKGAYLVIDEIIFDERISPFLDPIRYPNMILISSYSKTYNIPGLKLGHLVADEHFIDQFYRHASTTYGSPPSFLYFAATCLMKFERSFRLQSDVQIPAILEGELSKASLLFEEFKLWSREALLHKKFQNYVVEKVTENSRTAGVEKIYGLDDPSPNVVLRLKGEGCAYAACLDILATRNISTMPVECFSPPKEWPRDLRVTVSVKPDQLVDGFTRLVDFIDNRFAWESSPNYMHPDDKDILTDIGLYDMTKTADLRALPFKRCQALSDIFHLVANKDPHETILRAGALVGIADIWKMLSREQFVENKLRLEESKQTKIDIDPSMGRNDISLGLLKLASGKLPSDVTRVLTDYFSSLENVSSADNLPAILMHFSEKVSAISQKQLSTNNITEMMDLAEIDLSLWDENRFISAMRNLEY